MATLDEGLERFTAVWLMGRNLSSRSREEYARDVRGLLQFLARQTITQIDQVSLVHLKAYEAAMMGRSYTQATRRRKLIAIKLFFTCLTELGLAAVDVAARLIPPPTPPENTRSLNEAERAQLLSACQHHRRDTAILQLFLQTDIRLSELARLRLFDLTLSDLAGELQVRRNNGLTESVMLTADACAALRAWLAVRPAAPFPALFISRFRRPLDKRSIQHRVACYVQAAGIKNASVHTLSYTAVIAPTAPSALSER